MTQQTESSGLALEPPSPAPGREENSPPRKRPRTKAPQPTASNLLTDVVPKSTAPAPSAQPEGPTFCFSIQPLHRFKGASASIKRPREVTHFSFDDNHEYAYNDLGINYYVAPPIGADLKEGFDTFKHHEDRQDAHLDALLKALIDKEKEHGEGARPKADFVTWRGMMTKIMTAPFDYFAEFGMFATLYDGTIYIEEDFPSRATECAAEANQPPPRYQHPDQQSRDMMTYWGYKFETLALIPTLPASTPPQEIEKYQRSIVSNHAQHCSIVSTSFGPHNLILGGEVDGLLARKPQNPEAPVQWVELKTAEELPPPAHQQHRDILKFERKLLKFWAQSFLLGVPKIIVGFRSKAGILRGLQTFNTHELPGMVRRGTNCWDGNVCINFATEFLGWLKETVTEEGVYSIVLRKKSGVVEVKKVKEGTGGIVSEEFLAWRKSKIQGQMAEKKGGATNPATPAET
ncbi:RAI1-domain-containing protein [Setomelanomma holmii]|uniref:Decapping nuclease n=1 Tax=Setomelanomma holmii TaxID=210430 RepID=A0A9P4HE52_9PLEO|nr:RAI1-domain-containing protein [Setomelanomma holmii]